jgi:hypothetical protein
MSYSKNLDTFSSPPQQRQYEVEKEQFTGINPYNEGSPGFEFQQEPRTKLNDISEREIESEQSKVI